MHLKRKRTNHKPEKFATNCRLNLTLKLGQRSSGTCAKIRIVCCMRYVAWPCYANTTSATLIRNDVTVMCIAVRVARLEFDRHGYRLFFITFCTYQSESWIIFIILNNAFWTIILHPAKPVFSVRCYPVFDSPSRLAPSDTFRFPCRMFPAYF